jgi:hypothetical protein
MRQLKLQYESDNIGALASMICLIHCFATPFIFISAASLEHSHHYNSPLWWSLIEIVLMIISFIAVFWSAKSSPQNWTKYALYISWIILAFFILNEKFDMIRLPEFMVYLPAFSLIVIHLYNRKHTRCKSN